MTFIPGITPVPGAMLPSFVDSDATVTQAAEADLVFAPDSSVGCGNGIDRLPHHLLGDVRTEGIP